MHHRDPHDTVGTLNLARPVNSVTRLFEPVRPPGTARYLAALRESPSASGSSVFKTAQATHRPCRASRQDKGLVCRRPMAVPWSRSRYRGSADTPFPLLAGEGWNTPPVAAIFVAYGTFAPYGVPIHASWHLQIQVVELMCISSTTELKVQPVRSPTALTGRALSSLGAARSPFNADLEHRARSRRTRCSAQADASSRLGPPCGLQ